MAPRGLGITNSSRGHDGLGRAAPWGRGTRSRPGAEPGRQEVAGRGARLLGGLAPSLCWGPCREGLSGQRGVEGRMRYQLSIRVADTGPGAGGPGALVPLVQGGPSDVPNSQAQRRQAPHTHCRSKHWVSLSLAFPTGKMCLASSPACPDRERGQRAGHCHPEPHSSGGPRRGRPAGSYGTQPSQSPGTVTAASGAWAGYCPSVTQLPQL